MNLKQTIYIYNFPAGFTKLWSENIQFIVCSKEPKAPTCKPTKSMAEIMRRITRRRMYKAKR